MSGEDDAMKRLRTARESDDLAVAFRVYQERTDQRLAQGAATMSETRSIISQMSEQIESLKPKPKPPWPIVTFGFVAITALCGWVWQMARYPDRSEFESAKIEANNRLREIDSRLSSINLEIERLRVQLTQKGGDAKRR